MAFLDDSAWRYFWHPVCKMSELAAAAADDRPVAVTLLGERIAVAEIAGAVAAFPDRCIHRSTQLSIGRIEAGGLRCAYHGWLYDAGGACVEIPSMPDYSIPPGFRLRKIEARVAYDLVWLRLEPEAGTQIPGCPAWGDDAFRCVEGEPYTWPTSAGRRLENFVDLSHFPFVHDGSLGDRRRTTVPIADIARVEGRAPVPLRTGPRYGPARRCPDGADRLPDLDAVHDQSRILLCGRRTRPALDDGLADRVRNLPQLLVYLPHGRPGRRRSTPSRVPGSRPRRGSAGDRGAGSAGDPGSGRGAVRAGRRGLARLSPLAARTLRGCAERGRGRRPQSRLREAPRKAPRKAEGQAPPAAPDPLRFREGRAVSPRVPRAARR